MTKVDSVQKLYEKIENPNEHESKIINSSTNSKIDEPQNNSSYQSIPNTNPSVTTLGCEDIRAEKIKIKEKQSKTDAEKNSISDSDCFNHIIGLINHLYQMVLGYYLGHSSAGLLLKIVISLGTFSIAVLFFALLTYFYRKISGKNAFVRRITTVEKTLFCLAFFFLLRLCVYEGWDAVSWMWNGNFYYFLKNSASNLFLISSPILTGSCCFFVFLVLVLFYNVDFHAAEDFYFPLGVFILFGLAYFTYKGFFLTSGFSFLISFIFALISPFYALGICNVYIQKIEPEFNIEAPHFLTLVLILLKYFNYVNNEYFLLQGSEAMTNN